MHIAHLVYSLICLWTWIYKLEFYLSCVKFIIIKSKKHYTCRLPGRTWSWGLYVIIDICWKGNLLTYSVILNTFIWSESKQTKIQVKNSGWVQTCSYFGNYQLNFYASYPLDFLSAKIHLSEYGYSVLRNSIAGANNQSFFWGSDSRNIAYDVLTAAVSLMYSVSATAQSDDG